MWLSKRISKNSVSAVAEKGEVTLSSAENWEADASQSVRNISSFLPYGYTAVPPAGSEVLLLPVSDGTVALGVKAGGGNANAGEIKIRSLGGACIELKNDGSVVINGAFKINREGEIV